MGLGRITRFAPTPPGARRIGVMRAGRAGVKALAPPADLFEDFQREKAARRRDAAGDPHAEAFRRVRYAERFRAHVRSSPEAQAALRAVVDEARERDVYLMCMCPYRTPGDACHTYLLLDLARALAPSLALLPEPRPPRG